jgi:hypothetical protein
MTLLETQFLFSKLSVQLLARILATGYQFTYGQTSRDPRVAALYADEGIGIKHSLHSDRLAIDVNLYKDGQYLTLTSDHKQFGDFWKGLHPLCRWGGDFSKPDGNHYSLTWQGRA